MTIEKHGEYPNRKSRQLWLPFYGGLGDVILRCYETRFWHFLENTEERTAVVVSSVNPFTSELFKWHGNRLRIVLYELSHLVDDFGRRRLYGEDFHKAIAEFAGLSWPIDLGEFHAPPPPGWKPTFHAPDYLDDRGHFVFHPFAGLEHRSLSGEALRSAIRFLGELPVTVYVPSRDFVRFQAGRAGHGAEELPKGELPGNFVLLRNLSVPATLNLIRNARGFLGTHSSLVLAAAKEGIPSLAFYPEFLESKFKVAERYESYVRLEHMTALSMGSVTRSRLTDWFSQTFGGENFPNGRADQSRVDRLARWVISRGGKINIDWFCPPDFLNEAARRDIRKWGIDSVGKLPRGRFVVWRLNFSNLPDFGDSDLAELREIGAGIETITNLNLTDTSITQDGIEFLDWLGNSLQNIGISERTRTTEIAKRIASVLPHSTLV